MYNHWGQRINTFFTYYETKNLVYMRGLCIEIITYYEKSKICVDDSLISELN